MRVIAILAQTVNRFNPLIRAGKKKAGQNEAKTGLDQNIEPPAGFAQRNGKP